MLFLFIVILGLRVSANEDGVERGSSSPTFGYDVVTGPFSQYVSGSMHYFRVHPSDWRHRLQRLRWAGLHAVQTYIEWGSHEPEPGVYDFSGILDLTTFLKIAQQEGLFVILRPGPYICAERDMGGLPYWLLRLEPNVRLRSSDPKFMKYVKKWFDVLLPMLKPFMLENGGPITMVQVENEYGNYDTCDFQYLTDLAAILREGLGQNVFLFSTDNGRTAALKCAKIPYVYATVDFGPGDNYTEKFLAQRIFEPHGPLICSEFYTGWLDHWGKPHSTKGASEVSSALRQLLEMGASVNFYVFHGGTSFGFGAGSDEGETFLATPTSYDYDAPLSEAGDTTDKYFDIRNVIKEFFKVPQGLPPPPVNKYQYGDVFLTPTASAFEVLEASQSKEAVYPLTFEALGQPNGIVAYQYILEDIMTDPALLTLNEVHDRAYVYTDMMFQGVASRENVIYQLPIFAFPNETLTIFVESQGRVTGRTLKDFKGLTTTPTLNGRLLRNCKMTPIDLVRPHFLLKAMDSSRERFSWNVMKSGMMFYEGTLHVPEKKLHPMNTYVRLDNWRKGYIWINGFLLGRYWPVMGPQLTLFVPHGILKRGTNDVLVFELEGVESDSEIKISFVDQAQINGETPK